MKSLLFLGPNSRQLWCKDKAGWHISTTTPTEPVWVVTDLPDESFAEIEMPRLFGRDRSTFIARQLASRFPDTPYRTALTPHHVSGLMERLAPTHQLFLGIASPERLDADIGDMPITGVWPISLLLTHFCHSRKLPAELLLVLPSPEALRIVFLKKHTPLLTRLAPVANDIKAQTEEIIRTRRYLENTRMIERGQTCPVLLLGDAAAFASPLAGAQMTLIAPPPPWDSHPPADWHLPLFDLALTCPAGQVAPIGRRTEFLAKRLRLFALGAAALLLLVSLWAASGNLSVILDTLRQQEQAKTRIQQLQSKIAELEQKTGKFGVDPELLRRAIAIDEKEITSVPAIEDHLQALSLVLSGFPDLRLKQLEWRLLADSEKPCAKTAGSATPETAEAPPPDEGEPANDRRVELQFELSLPETYGPGDQARVLRQISQQLGKIKGIALTQDPARELDQGVLQGSTTSTAEKQQHWCLSLPGSTKTSAKPGEAKP